MSCSTKLLVLCAVLVVSGCAAERAFREGRGMIEAGQVESGLAKVDQAARRDPSQQEYRAYYMRQRDLAVQRLLSQADTVRLQGRMDEAENAYNRALSLDPASERARQALASLGTERRHNAVVADAETALKAGRLRDATERLRIVLAENPRHRGAQTLSQKIQDQAGAPSQNQQQLDAALQRPITLEFRDTDLKTVFDLMSRTADINFFFDKDLRPDIKTTVFVRNTPIEDVIRFLLVTNQLERKVLNENTLLIYPNTPAKVKDYQELITKTFYLHHADVKVAANKGMVKTKDVFIDEKLKLLMMRDTPDAIRMAEKLIAAQDIAESEVMLEVEVMEVGSSLLTDLGIRYPDQVAVSVVGAGGAGVLTVPEIRNANSSLYQISVTNPLLIMNLKQQDGRANTLANPRIRVKDGQKAKVHIGDKVPVITTTLSATSFVSESVNYLDVGLKLEVEPTISLSNEVGIKVGLEVSNIVREIRSGSGTLTYQIGTRNAATVLHLKDGETQILAGLINDEERKVADRFPGLGNLPVLGRLFSSHRDTSNKSEIVLLITPRILRTVARPESRITEFLSGTESAVGAAPLVMRTGEKTSITPPSPAGVAPPPTAASIVAPAAKPDNAPRAPVPTASVIAKAEAAPPPPPGVPRALPGMARFALSGPANARVREEFPVALDVALEAPIKGGAFELAYDHTRFKLVRIEPGAFLKGGSFKSEPVGGDGRLSVTYTGADELRGQGNLARAIFQAIEPGASLIQMEKPTITDRAGKVLATRAPAGLTVSLAP